MLNKDEVFALIHCAKEAAKNSFLITSKAKGAAILMDSGDIYGGCIVQSTISGLGTCAERCAIDHAIIHGKYKIKAIVTMSRNKTFPCGACLQMLTDLSQVDNRDIEIIASNTEGNYIIRKLSQLLPERYISQSKDKKIKKYRIR